MPLVADLLPSSFIYGGGGTPKHINCSKPCAAPPPQFTPPIIFTWCLGEALHGSLHHHRHHAVVLTELSLDTLLDHEFEGRHQAECVQNSEVPYVWCLIGRNEKKFDYVNRVVLTLPLTVNEGTRTTLFPLVDMHHHDLACA